MSGEICETPAIVQCCDRPTTLHGILDQAATLHPTRVCVQFGSDAVGLTYEQINSATILCASHVVALADEPAIALICADRSYGMLVCMLGIMRAGWAYCPCEPDFPLPRVQAMLEVADIEFCLTPVAQAPQQIIAAIESVTTLAVHENGFVATLDGGATISHVDKVPTEVLDTSTAYVIFTSGSTGKPKGCMVPHRGSALYAYAVVENCGLDGSMTFLFKTPYVFDVSIQDIFSAFATAGKLVIAEPSLHKDAVSLASSIVDHSINCVAFTPTLLVEFLNYLSSDAAMASAVGGNLQRVLASGEALPTATCRQLFELCPNLDGELHNLYGPTEASVSVSHFRVSSSSLGADVVVPIGSPFPYIVFRHFNTSLYEGKTVTPQFMTEADIGDVGELFIGGDCLAHGYINDIEKTNAAFFHYPEIVARPANAASRFSLYKTGDLVRLRADGAFVMLGRTDHQVKIGGVRIECEEISAVLKSHPLVDDALVTVFDGPFGNALVAYTVRRDEAASVHEADSKIAIADASSNQSTAVCSSIDANVDVDGKRVAENWAVIYDEQYAQVTASRVDPRVDWTSYVCSYTRGPHLEPVMAEWAGWSCEPVLKRVGSARDVSCSACRVAEIGCGVGMLLFRIAPTVCAAPEGGHYLGTDVAGVALEHVKSVHKTFEHYKDLSVSTAQIAAHELGSVCAPRSQDVVLCNSVSQYFTGVSYLLKALQASVECVKPGGAVVFGDLLNRRYHFPLKVDVEVFHALRAPHNSITAASIWDRAKMKTTVDPNVFYDDSLFHRLERASDSLFGGRLARVDLRLKRGKWHSEFTRFRYDVELVLANDVSAPQDDECSILKLQRIGVEAATTTLGLTKQEGQPYCGPAPGILENWVYDLVTSLTDLTDGVVVTLPNARTVRPVHLARWIEMAVAQKLSLETMPKWLWPVDASDVQGEFGVEPEALFELRLPTGWTSRVIFGVDPAMLELVLLRERVASTRWLSAVRDCGRGALSAVELAAMANGADSVAAVSKSIGKDEEESLQEWNKTLKDWAAQSSLLPVMRPNVYIPLDALPKNTAGKVDRGRLPNALEAFDRLTGSGAIAPETDDEEKMAKCFERALKRDRVCVETAFHMYGGHSLTALTLRSEISKVFGVYLPAALFTQEHCTVRSLLKEMEALDNKDQRAVDPKIASRFPLPVERTWSTFFHVDNVAPPVYVAAQKLLPLMPKSSLSIVFSYFVPRVEIDLEHPVDDLVGLVAKLIEGHPILRARYSYKRELIIPAADSSVNNVGVYCSWDVPPERPGMAIMQMYECPLCHIIGHRKPNQKLGPAVNITVLWHHIISDAHSDDIVKRDIKALARGESLQSANLSAYAACSQHSLAKPTPLEQISGRWCDEPKFRLPHRACCKVKSISGLVVHTVCMSVAVSKRAFDSDVDKARFFLDRFCSATDQFRGRLGMLTNARSKVDADASSLIGALVYFEEFAYDLDTNTLESLGRATDDSTGLVINVQNSYRDLPVEEMLTKLGFDHCDQVLAGDPAHSIRQGIMSGGLGINLGAGESLYIECTAVRDATIFLTMHPDTRFDGLGIIRFLQQHLRA